MDVTDQLRKAMKDSGLALYAISRGAGLDYPAVYRFYHKQRDIRMGSAAKLVKFLGLELTKKTGKAQKGR